MKVPGDPAALGFGFVGKLQTRAGQVAIRGRQLSTGAMNAPVLNVTPGQGDQRQGQQHRQSRRRPRKRRPGDGKFNAERDRRRQVLGKGARHHFVSTGRELLHRELRIMREFFANDLSRTIVKARTHTETVQEKCDC